MSISSSEKSMNQSVSKLMHLLNCLSDSRVPLRLQEIAEMTHMPQATVFRYLSSLMTDGYVFQDNISERYALTWKICEIGDHVQTRMNLRTISNDIVTELYRDLDYGICLVIEQDMECMYLDCIYNPASIGFSLIRIGRQSPLHATGSGKVLLAAYTNTELEKFINKKGLPKLTEHTITAKEDLIRELEHIREVGYALDDEECEPGLRCISVPIYSYNKKIAAAISAFGAAEIISEQCIENTLLPLLRPAARKISYRLGGYQPED